MLATHVVMRSCSMLEQLAGLARFGPDQHEAMHAGPARVEKYRLEGLDDALLLQAAEVSHEFFEMAGAHLLASRQGTLPAIKDRICAHDSLPWARPASGSGRTWSRRAPCVDDVRLR
jgi:hypothetical protein